MSATPNDMPRTSAHAPAARWLDAEMHRLDEAARQGGNVTSSKAYRAAAARAGLRRS